MTPTLPRITLKKQWLPVVQVTLALAMGALLGLLVVAPQFDALGGPTRRLTEWLIPAAALALLILSSLRSPLAAFLFTVALEPYSSFLYLDIDVAAGLPALSLARTMLAFLLLLLLLQAALGRRHLAVPAAPEWLYLVFLLSLLLSVARSRYGLSFALQSILDAYLVPLVAFYLARQLVPNLAHLRRVGAWLTVAGVMLALLVIREQLTGEVLFNARETARYSENLQRVVSLMGNAAPMGISIALTLPLGLALLLHVARRPADVAWRGRAARLALPAALLIISLGAYMTYNRATWLAVVLTLLLFLAFSPATRRWLLPVLLILALIVLLSWQTLTDSAAVNERLLDDKSIGYRGDVARLALDMVRSNPLLGRGYYNFGPIAKEQYGWDPVPLFGIYPPAHNSFMFILVSGGLLALLPYGLWFAWLAWEGIRRYRGPGTSVARREALLAGAALLLLYVIASATFDNVDAVSMNLMFAASVGAIWGATTSRLPSAVD
ncbi:MAG: O-antigen ligase family protein [Caldilineales bacterium]